MVWFRHSNKNNDIIYMDYLSGYKGKELPNSSKIFKTVHNMISSLK